MEHKTQEERMCMNKTASFDQTHYRVQSSLPIIVSSVRASVDNYYSNGLQTF